MKELCNKLMSLDCGSEAYKDYGQIAFLFFIIDENFINKKTVGINDFCLYLYRFYCDNPKLAKKHTNKLINNIFVCSYQDIYSNAIENLDLIKEKTNLIEYDSENIYWKYDVDINNESNLEIFCEVQTYIATKYTGIIGFEYSSKLEPKDYEYGENAKAGQKLFNRCLENINYCFICGEEDINKLRIIRLQNNAESKFSINNHLLLCKCHADEYEKRKIKIDTSGIAIKDNKQLGERLEINTLKKIRKYLRSE